MKTPSTKHLILALGLLALASCQGSRELGSKGRPLKVLFVPTDDTKTISNHADKIARFIEKSVSQKLYNKADGFYVEASVPNSYVAVVEAFGTKRADFASLDTFSYVLLKEKKYPAEANLLIERGLHERAYKAQILARVDSGINKLEDLNGKKFAFVDPSSPAGYIVPAALFKEKNIKLGNEVFAMRHDNVVSMVYNKQVDAGVTYYSPPEEVVENGKKVMKIKDARARVLTQYPDVEQKIKIVSFTQDIPNAPWVIRSQLFDDPVKNEQVKTAIRDAVLEYIATPEGKETMLQLYNITGLVPTSDAELAPLIGFFKTSKVDLEAEAQKLKK